MSETINILIPLDVILDTRIATIALMNETKAIEILKSGYHKRRSDFFKGIDKKEFDLKYSQRNEATLAKAQCTNIVYVLKDMIEQFLNQAISSHKQSKIIVTINTYPYEIAKESRSLILSAISVWLGEMCELSSIHISDKDLSPDFIKNRYDVLFMYHYAHWLEYHTENFKKTSINTSNLYVPAISFEQDITDQVIEKLKKESMHPLEALKLLTAPFVNIEPIDVSAFSVISIKE